MRRYKTNPQKIKGLLLLKGLTLKEIRKELGISKVYLSHVINGRRYGKRVREFIAKKLNMSYHDLWEK